MLLVASATVATALALTACSSSTSTPAAAGKTSNFSAAYVMSDNLGDHGFNDSAAKGFAALEKEGIKTKLLQASPSDPQLWRQNLEATSSAASYNLIFTGPGMHDNLAAVAPQHPDQKYVFFDDELAAPNVLSVKYKQNEGSYLAGVLAALASTDNKTFPLSANHKHVAIVAGQDLPVIEDFIGGFKQGAKSVDPSITVDVSFIDNFNDAQKAYDLTKTAYSAGADVVFNVAGPAGLGILKAASDANKYAIGVDSDQNSIQPKNILASMLKNIGSSVELVTKQVQEGKAKFGTVESLGLQSDGVGLVYNSDLVPTAVQATVDAAKKKVVDGTVSVVSAFK